MADALHGVGIEVDAPAEIAAGAPRCSVLAWAESGAMWLTGHADRPPLAPDAPVATRLAAASALLAGVNDGATIGVRELLTKRAAERGYRRRGRRSANGTCRLLRAVDGWLAVNLARPDDVASVPAIVAPWGAGRLDEVAARTPARELADRCQLLGVPAATVPPSPDPVSAPVVIHHFGSHRRIRPRPPVVVDLSALWAGPLCSELLSRGGAEVAKVATATRPGGDVIVDLGSDAGRRRLLELLLRADVVIDASRPRALRQLGIVAEDVVGETGATWVSITGYGRGEGADRVAFGDDAAAAAGLLARDSEGAPVFCADAIADPISGLFAALCAASVHRMGGGAIVEVAMTTAAAYVAAPIAAGEHPATDGHVFHGEECRAIRRP